MKVHADDKKVTDPAVLPERILEMVNVKMLQWQDCNVTLKELWRLPNSKFVVKLQGAIDFIYWSLNAYADIMGPKPQFKTGRGIELQKQYGFTWIHDKAVMSYDHKP